YSLCSASYNFYPRKLSPASQKHLQPSHQLSPVLTLDDKNIPPLLATARTP
ncbi:hypothetical protein PGT21_001017, partial [Puccinia graminis f. sp. tritici]